MMSAKNQLSVYKHMKINHEKRSGSHSPSSHNNSRRDSNATKDGRGLGAVKPIQIIPINLKKEEDKKQNQNVEKDF